MFNAQASSGLSALKAVERRKDVRMARFRLASSLILMLSLTSGASTTGALAQQADFGKLAIEAPTKSLLKSTSSGDQTLSAKPLLPTPSLAAPAQFKAPTLKMSADMTKGSIELPSKALLKGSGASLPSTLSSVNPSSNSSEPRRLDHQPASPGLVHWHKDFKEAVVAAHGSHKPVMLFQMMGRLDEEFC